MHDEKISAVVKPRHDNNRETTSRCRKCKQERPYHHQDNKDKPRYHIELEIRNARVLLAKLVSIMSCDAMTHNDFLSVHCLVCVHPLFPFQPFLASPPASPFPYFARLVCLISNWHASNVNQRIYFIWCNSNDLGASHIIK